MTNLKKKLMAGLGRAKKPLKELVSAVLLLSTMSYLAVKAPELHDKWLRHYVGQRTFLIQVEPNGGGGTGFQVKAPSGKDYILTNDHICDGSKNGILFVTNEQGIHMPRRIIERSTFSDLCVVEGWPKLSGLNVGSEPLVGDHIAVVGHPRLMPLVVSKGQIFGASDVSIPDFIIDEENPASKCALPKHKIADVKMEVWGFTIEFQACFVITKDAYMSTAVIFGGNSGSPVVDYLGRVIGVAFAANDTNWGRIVNIQDVIKMLSKY